MQRRCIGMILLLICAALGGVTMEKKLAGISLGMKPTEVIELLGDPSAILMAQPPIITKSVGAGALGDTLPTMGNMAENMLPEADRPNSLILIYNDQEIEIGASQSSEMGSMPGGMMPGMESSGPKESQIPVWAYAVRATKLSLGQQELIYEINDTYSVGITITGAGAEAKVTDIVACSFQPFTRWPNDPTHVMDRKSVNFFYSATRDKTKRKQLPAGTSKRVVIGSRLDEVLTNHGWPQNFFPFVTDSITKIILSRPAALIPSVTVKPGGAAGGSALATAPLMPGGDLPGGMGSATGDKPATFTDGDKMTMSIGFTKNALLLYTNENVAFTLVDFTVVRIQIGSGVVKPPAPPTTSVGLGPGR